MNISDSRGSLVLFHKDRSHTCETDVRKSYARAHSSSDALKLEHPKPKPIKVFARSVTKHIKVSVQKSNTSLGFKPKQGCFRECLWRSQTRRRPWSSCGATWPCSGPGSFWFVSPPTFFTISPVKKKSSSSNSNSLPLSHWLFRYCLSFFLSIYEFDVIRDWSIIDFVWSGYSSVSFLFWFFLCFAWEFNLCCVMMFCFI